jgi:type VI secretion system protein ImpH
MGREADAVALFESLARAPYRHDFYQTMRRLECLYDDRPRWGEAERPIDEPVRLGQDPDLSFAPAPLASFQTGGTHPRLQVRLFGLFGPNGPLPTHMTEYARERLYHAGDPTFSRFVDLFHHRFLALFYRAWAQAQPHVNHDRPSEDRFRVYVGAFVGMAPDACRERDSVSDWARLYHAGQMIRSVRNAEGLGQILAHYFQVPVAIEEFVGHWLRLAYGDRTRLGAANATLGSTAVVGSHVWDRQHKFRVRLGPLTLDQYRAFLPGGARLRQLVDWVRMYLCFELDWDVQLVLREDEVPKARLGAGHQLRWTTWLGRRPERSPAGDLCLDPEALVAASTA